jgi:ribosome-associated translation inhibitor RaiA
MRVPLQIVTRGVELSEAERSAIRKRAGSLDRLSDHVQRCRVGVTATGSRWRSLCIEVALSKKGEPGIAMQRDVQEAELPSAVREVFATIKRRVQRRVQGERDAKASFNPAPSVERARALRTSQRPDHARMPVPQ